MGGKKRVGESLAALKCIFLFVLCIFSFSFSLSFFRSIFLALKKKKKLIVRSMKPVLARSAVTRQDLKLALWNRLLFQFLWKVVSETCNTSQLSLVSWLTKISESFFLSLTLSHTNSQDKGIPFLPGEEVLCQWLPLLTLVSG